MDILRVDSKYASAIIAGAFAISAILAIIGAGLLIYVHVKKNRAVADPASMVMTPEEEAKLASRRKWGMALLVIGAIGAAVSGVVMYMRSRPAFLSTPSSDMLLEA